MQRREAAFHDDDQRDLLRRHGYPHVLNRWRFHMTLTDSLPAEPGLCDTLHQAASSHFAAALAQPLACDALSLFIEPAPGQPFRLLQRYPLA